jgi:hypothetical protein
VRSMWPGGPVGKLLGAGIGGVVLIAAFLEIQGTRKVSEAASSTTPMVLVGSPASPSPSPAPTSTIRSVEDLAPDTEPSPAAPAQTVAPIAPVGSAPKAVSSPRAPRSRDKAASPNSNKDKAKHVVDFGI